MPGEETKICSQICYSMENQQQIKCYFLHMNKSIISPDADPLVNCVGCGFGGSINEGDKDIFLLIILCGNILLGGQSR